MNRFAKVSSLTNLPNRDPFRNYLPNRVPFQSICKGGLFCYGCRQKQWRDHDVAITTDEKGSDVAVRWVCLQHHRREAFHVGSMQKPPTAMARHVPTWNVSRHCILRDLLPSNAAIASSETLACRPDLLMSHLHAS